MHTRSIIADAAVRTPEVRSIFPSGYYIELRSDAHMIMAHWAEPMRRADAPALRSTEGPGRVNCAFSP